MNLDVDTCTEYKCSVNAEELRFFYFYPLIHTNLR